MKTTDYDESYDIEEVKAARISLHMIVKRQLPSTAQKWTHDEITIALNKITHLRLDRENVGHIDNLELLGKKVTNVYLQHNRIQKIENLDCLVNLTFITLASNQISKIEGLTHLKKLAFLDLSQNQIKSFDIDELPQSLVILSLKDNPCTSMPDYRGRIVQDLHRLQQLDGIEVSKTEKLEAGFQVSSSEEEDSEDDELDGKYKPQKQLAGNSEDIFRDAATDILLRSQSRLEDALAYHLENVAVLDDIRIKEDLPPSARYPTVQLAASARLSASRGGNALREQLRAARTATASSVSLSVGKR